MPRRARTATCDLADARARLRLAEAYLDIAQLVLSDPSRDGFSNVSAGLAVLAGIAASDAICCARLKARHRGEDHRGAAVLLAEATPNGKGLAQTLTRLLDVKDAAHYGVNLVNSRRAKDAVNWAGRLVGVARTEVER